MSVYESNDLYSFGVKYYDDVIKKSLIRMMELKDLGNYYQDKLDKVLEEINRDIHNDLERLGYDNKMGVLSVVENEEEELYFFISLEEHDVEDIQNFCFDEKLQYCAYCCLESELSEMLGYIQDNSDERYYLTK